MSDNQGAIIDLDAYEAAILDMDGVITKTAVVHRKAWKRMFDEFLHSHVRESPHTFTPFGDDDYYRFVDGKPRYDGVESFLSSRNISLPRGTPDDSPEQETVCGLGNRKNGYFLEYLKKDGVEAYDSTLDFVKELSAAILRVAAISSSENARAVLEAAGVTALFPVVVDGVDSARLNLPGKPHPDIFLEAARRLGVEPRQAMVLEDAGAGVAAAKAGGFAMVIAIDRSGSNTELARQGADMVITDLSEIRSKYHGKTDGGKSSLGT